MSVQAVSSVYGEIKKMLLTYPESSPLPNDVILQRYHGIFKALGKNIHFVILAYKDAHKKIMQTAKNAGLSERHITLVEAKLSPVTSVREFISRQGDGSWLAFVDDPSHSIWAQDAYCILNDDSNNCIMMEPLSFNRHGDHFIAEQIAAHTDIQIETTQYYIEGGNMLCGDNYVLIGNDYLHESMATTGESWRQVTEGLKRCLGVDYVKWVGLDEEVNFDIEIHQGDFQPIFHIDMFITLAGKNTAGKEIILVGDTRLAKTLLEQTPVPEKISNAFDAIAKQLQDDEKLNCEVMRVPLDLWLNDDDDPTTGTFLTYNNCLIEVYGQQKKVYIPAYASVSNSSVNRRKLDSEIKHFYENQLGFEVTMMDGSYHELCKNGGSLHCITKTLRRGKP